MVGSLDAQSLFENQQNFQSDISSLFQRTAKEAIIDEGERFKTTYESLSTAQKDTIFNLFQFINSKDIRINPTLYYFIYALNGASALGYDSNKMNTLIDLCRQTLKKRDNKEIGIYFLTLKQFFENNALYFSNYNSLLVDPNIVTFEYVDNVEPVSSLEFGEEEYSEEESEDVEDAFDSWDNENVEDDDVWGEDDDAVDDDDNFEEEANNEDINDTSVPYYMEEEQLPVIEGPVARFNAADLTILTSHDSVLISGMNGTLMLHNRTLVGEGGRMDWSAVGLPTEDVYVQLGKYTFQTDKPEFQSGQSTLTYRGKLHKDILGIYSFKSEKRRDSLSAKYPRFMSYETNIKVDIDPMNNIEYSGGFSLEGRKISSSSVVSPFAKIKSKKEEGKSFEAVSPRFFLEDSTVTSDASRVSIYLNGDSLYHPMRRFEYRYNDKQLTLQKTRGRFKEAPYYSNLFDVNIYADMLRWHIGADSLDLSTLEARSQIPCFVESSEFFLDSRFDELTGFYKFNPLLLIVGYARKVNSGIFNVMDLAAFAKQKAERVDAAMTLLADLAFIRYDRSSGDIEILKKAYHYVLSKQKRKDYDNLLIPSLTDEKANITYRFADKKLVIRGIERFYLSKVLDVYILPRENEITMLPNRDFSFDGTVFAGNFEYAGSDFNFNYNQFIIEMNQIDSIQFYTQEKMPDGTTRRKKVDNKLLGAPVEQQADSLGDTSKLSATTGTLYINESKNKSGRKVYPRYPWFNTDSETIVYFDDKKVLNGAYSDRSVYFVVPSFKLDSLAEGDMTQLAFQGTFVTSGLLPDFKQKLEVMPDNSMGFVHQTPAAGYDIKGGIGKFYNQLKMDSRGLRGDGRIEHLDMNLVSNDFIFYGDSIRTNSESKVVMAPKQGNNRHFPDFKLDGFRMNWKTNIDQMFLYNKANPFEFYSGSSTLNGYVNIQPDMVLGGGIFKTNGSVTKSEKLSFTDVKFDAQNAAFVIESSNPDKPALAADNVSVNFNLVEKKSKISPEVAGDAALSFPFAQVKTSIPNAVWNLNDNVVRMRKSEDIDISQSYFYTTRKELDSLAFNAEFAEYDINALRLNVGGIPFIKVADAKITPEGGAMTILENAKLEVLHHAKIKIDTLNGYHSLDDGNIEIISRNKFQGDAQYQLVTLSDTFQIKFDRFELKEFPNEKSKKREAPVLHTVSQGTIPEEDEAIISPRFFYKGDVIMRADRKALELDGFVKLDLLNNQADFWIRYNRTADTTNVVLKYEDIETEDGTKLNTGMYYKQLDGALDFRFLDPDIDLEAHPIFIPSGYLSFDETSNRFRIEDQEKTAGTSYAGSAFSSDEKTTDFQYEGPMDLSGGYDHFPVKVAGFVNGNGEKELMKMNAFISYTPKIPSAIMEVLSEKLVEITEMMGVPSAHEISKNLLHNAANIIGNKATKNYEEANIDEYAPLVDFSQELQKSIVFSNVNLKWNANNTAFYSLGGILGLSNLMQFDINAKVEGFLEIRYDEDEGVIMDFFFKVGQDWAYFHLSENRLSIVTNNQEAYEIIESKSNIIKAKPGDFIFETGTKENAQTFVDDFRATYYNKDDGYVLSGNMIKTDLVNAAEQVGGRRKRVKKKRDAVQEFDDAVPTEIVEDNTADSLDESYDGEDPLDESVDETPQLKKKNTKKKKAEELVQDNTEDKKKPEKKKKSKKVKKPKKSKKKKEKPKEQEENDGEEEEDDDGF